MREVAVVTTTRSLFTSSHSHFSTVDSVFSFTEIEKEERERDVYIYLGRMWSMRRMKRLDLEKTRRRTLRLHFTPNQLGRDENVQIVRIAKKKSSSRSSCRARA